MTTHSDDALSLAGRIASEVLYPRMADAGALAVRYCALHATPLDDDQVTQLIRAAIDAADGAMHDIAREADTETARRLLGGAS